MIPEAVYHLLNDLAQGIQDGRFMLSEFRIYNSETGGDIEVSVRYREKQSTIKNSDTP